MATSEARERGRRAATVEPPWKVGELARRTGVSVRALHHYDEIGLLEPSLRTPSGHRLYARGDIERLQRIQSLRLMGFRLEEVKRLLDGAALSPREVIAAQLARVREQLALQTRLAERLSALASHLDTAAELSTGELCCLIEVMTTMEKHFTAEQLEALRERRERVGEARIGEVEGEWRELIPRVRSAMERGVDPTAPEVLELARRWRSLVEEFSGGDAAIERGVMAAYREQGDALRRQHGDAVPTPDLLEYIGRALAALRGRP